MPELHATPPPPSPAEPSRVKGRPGDPQKYAVDVKPSAIDGHGAFAAEPIPARRKIGEIRGESLSVKEHAGAPRRSGGS
jgi:hypothetical protein